MTNLTYYFWLAFLIFYIISPFDAHPFFFDDLIAAAVLFYLWRRNASRRNVRHRSSTGGHSQEDIADRAGRDLSVPEAYDMLGVKSGATLEEVKKAYIEKISRSHPDKVDHLSEELREKAKEITLKLNNAYDIIKKVKI